MSPILSQARDSRRANISISPEIREMGELLAQSDHRDFSNEVEWLIEQEWKRRQNAVKEEAQNE